MNLILEKVIRKCKWIGYLIKIIMLNHIRKTNISIYTSISRKTKIKCSNKSSIILKDGFCTRGEAYLSAEEGGKLEIGCNSFINVYSCITAMKSIIIGNNVLIANGVTVVDHDHNKKNGKLNEFVALPVVIEDGVWIGANCVITKGVTIGKNTIVAAGAVVNKDLPENVLAAGVPAKVLKNI